MEYETFVIEIPWQTREIIEKAMDIYACVERRDMFWSLDNEVLPEKFDKQDKIVGSLFLASLLVEGTCSQQLRHAGLTKEPVLDYFELEESQIRKLTKERYQHYYEDSFVYQIEEFQHLQQETIGVISNRDFLPEYILFNLLTDEFYCSGVIGDIFETIGWGSYTEIPEHPAVSLLSELLEESVTLRQEINQDALTVEHLFEPTDFSLSQSIEKPKTHSNYLRQYGEYLTDGTFLSNPAIGREVELKKLMLSILTPDKSTMLVGEAAVGKTALVNGLAYLIQKQQVPDLLKDLSIVKINTSSMVNGCIYRGMLEERFEMIMDELSDQSNTILFMDEIHSAIGAGNSSEDQLDIANMLKPYLDDGQIQMIGATTTEEYERFIMEVPAFKRRFERINIEEPKKEVVREILEGTIPRLEQVTHVAFDFQQEKTSLILDMLVSITGKKYRDYYDSVNNPDLALSILKKSFAYAAFEGDSSVRVDYVVEAIRTCDRLSKDARNRHANKLLQKFHEVPQEKTQAYGKVLLFPKNKK